MPPGRRHVFTSLASSHLHGDAKDAERRTCRFPDVVEPYGLIEVSQTVSYHFLFSRQMEIDTVWPE